jgi:DNA-binding response OmpR family regulator
MEASMRLASPSPTPGRPTVLLGFSDRRACADLASHLTRQGLRVRICPDPGQLATHADDDQPALIVTDFLLRPLDGFTMHRLLHATRPFPVMLRAAGTTPTRRESLAAEIAETVARGS